MSLTTWWRRTTSLRADVGTAAAIRPVAATRPAGNPGVAPASRALTAASGSFGPESRGSSPVRTAASCLDQPRPLPHGDPRPPAPDRVPGDMAPSPALVWATRRERHRYSEVRLTVGGDLVDFANAVVNTL